MISVPPLSWQILGAWPLPSAGLGYRATRILSEQGVSTLAEARVRATEPDFASTHGMGPSTLAEINRYLETCQQITDGTLQFAHVPDLFRRFLTESQIEILLRRYGLLRPDTASSRNFITLQDIGNELDITRERVRQIEKQAVTRLQGQLQQHCLSPLYAELRSILADHGGMIRCDHTASLDKRNWLGGYKASSILLLLHDIAPTHFTHHHETFSLFPLAELERTEAWVTQTLRHAPMPIPVADLLRELPTSMASGWSENALAVYVGAIPTVIATQDHRFLISDLALVSWLRELLDSQSSPIHYRQLTRTLNARLQPHLRLGPRRILLLLHHHPEFVQTQPGIYTRQD